MNQCAKEIRDWKVIQMPKKICAFVALWLVALLLAISPSSARAQAPAPVKIRVQITDTGFACETKSANCLDNQNGIFTIQVEQSSLVELTIVWAHKAYAQEEHIIIVEGYKLETDKLNATHREAVLKFIADKSGTFGFKCDLDCDVHDHLQKGQVRITRGGGGGAATALTPTTLTISPSASILAGGELVTLMTTLKDASGAPVSKAEVHFSVDADFVGTSGKMEIGMAKTDANGVAFLDYQPTLNAEQQKISAHFEGLGIYAESQQSTQIQVVGSPHDAYKTAPMGTENIAQVVAGAFIFVLLGVWTTYGFIVSQVFNIWRDT